MPIRVQLSRAKGWRMPPNTVKVDRSTIWGNPFRTDKPVDMTMANRWGWKIKHPHWVGADADAAVIRFAGVLDYDDAGCYAIRKELRGKNLACWCKLNQACHADVLLEIANQ